MNLDGIRGKALADGQVHTRKKQAQRRAFEFQSEVPSNYVALPGTDVKERLVPAAHHKLDDWKQSPTQFSVLYGGVGLGKSVLGVSMASHALREDYAASAGWVSWPDMLYMFSWNMADDPVGMLSAPGILIMDDIGADAVEMSNTQVKMLFDLIERRSSDYEKMTILTTNLSVATGPGSVPSIMGERSWDRITRSVTLLEFRGTSLRKKYRD